MASQTHSDVEAMAQVSTSPPMPAPTAGNAQQSLERFEHRPDRPSEADRAAAINMLPNPDPTSTHTCDACARDIMGHCFIRCAECQVTQDQGHVDLCADCFASGREPLNHRKTHAYRVMDKMSEKIFNDNWTAAEELSLIDQVKKHGLGAWDDIADSKIFYRRKSASELCTHYLDTYLCRFGSVLPPYFLSHRPDGTTEKVSIPPTGPLPPNSALNGLEVNSRELRSKTIAELGTNPQFRYEPSWDALAKKKAAQRAKEAAQRAAEALALAQAAAARVGAASNAGSTATSRSTQQNMSNGGVSGAPAGFEVSGNMNGMEASVADAGKGAIANGGMSGSGAEVGDNSAGYTSLEDKRNAIAKAAAQAANATALAAAAAATAAAEAGVDMDNSAGVDESCAFSAGGSSSSAKARQTQNRKRKRQIQSRHKEEEKAIKEWVSKLPGADLGGYAPLRGDFEVEHDNAAEELLANMEFRNTDHVSERQLKLDVIAVYNHRLDERERRKRFVVDHNLLDYKKHGCGKKRLKEDRELVARLRPFARFHSTQQHEELIDNLLLAKKMRMRIEQLQMYRDNGITTLAEGQEFEIAKRRRQEELASKKHRESASYLYDAHANSKLNNRDRNNRYSSRNNKEGSSNVNGGVNSNGVGGGADVSDGSADMEDGRTSDMMDLSSAPGVEYLSTPERRLCSELHLLPGYYLVVKDAMIQECARSGCLKKRKISNLAVMDSGRLDKLYDFFTVAGWVSEQPKEFEYSDGSQAVSGMSSVESAMPSIAPSASPSNTS